MTDDVQKRLAEIRARHQTSSSGVWEFDIDDASIDSDGCAVANIAYHANHTTVRRFGQEFSHSDGHFIANAHQDVPWLLEQADHLTVIAASWEGQWADMRDERDSLAVTNKQLNERALAAFDRAETAEAEVARLTQQLETHDNWNCANAERGAWSRAWAILTGQNEYGAHSDAAIVDAARSVRERADRAETSLSEEHLRADRALRNFRDETEHHRQCIALGNDLARRAEAAEKHLRDVNTILNSCGISDWEPYPDEPVSDWEKSLRTGGRMVSFGARVRSLANRAAKAEHASAKAEARVAELRGLIHSDMLASMQYCETCELAFQSPEHATVRCPRCAWREAEDAATSFQFGEHIALRICPLIDGRPEIWRVRRGHFDVMPKGPDYRVDMSRTEAIEMAQNLAADAKAKQDAETP